MDWYTLNKSTISLNEVRHKNIKYVALHVQPNNKLVSTAKRLVTNTNDTLSERMQILDQDVLYVSTWNNFNLQASGDHQRHIFSKWNTRDKYNVLCVSSVLWYVLHKDTKNDNESFHPTFCQVQIIKYVSDSYLCSCNLFTRVDYCCRHIFLIGVNLTQNCFHVQCWNNYCFYALCERNSAEINETFFRMRQIKYVLAPLIDELKNYQHFNNVDISMDKFNEIL